MKPQHLKDVTKIEFRITAYQGADHKAIMDAVHRALFPFRLSGNLRPVEEGGDGSGWMHVEPVILGTLVEVQRPAKLEYTHVPDVDGGMRLVRVGSCAPRENSAGAWVETVPVTAPSSTE